MNKYYRYIYTSSMQTAENRGIAAALYDGVEMYFIFAIIHENRAIKRRRQK